MEGSPLNVLRHRLPVLLAALGVALIGAARYLQDHLDQVQPWLEPIIGRRWLDWLWEVVPSALLVAATPLTFGALLLALAIGSPPPLDLGSTVGSTAVPAAAWRRIRALVALGVACAATATVLLLRTEPGTVAVLAWISAPLIAIIAAILADHARSTPLGNPFSHRAEQLTLLLLVAAALILVAHDLDHWRWAGIPDESFFFVGARGFAIGDNHTFLLSEDGVFGFHPVLSSYYQATFMWLFGMNAFGWRLSSAVALVASLPFVYLLTRELRNRRAGFFAAALFGSAQLAVGYAHLGYNNVQVYPAVAIPLAVLAWAMRRRSVTGYVLAGCFVGLSWFTYYTARLSLPLVILLVWSLGGWKRLREDRLAAAALFGGFVLVALPTLLQLPATAARMARLTGVTGGRPISWSESEPIINWLLSAETYARTLVQWLLTIFYGLWSEHGHFQWSPVVDPITLGLSMIGLWLGVLTLLRGRRDFFAPAYLMATFGVGAISPYPHPALTRLLFVAPFTAMLAAGALDQIMRRLTPSMAKGLGGSLLLIAIAWNIAALNYNVYVRYHGWADGSTAELIRVAQTLPPDCQIVVLHHTEGHMINVDNWLAAYGMAGRSTCLDASTPEAQQLLTTLQAPFLLTYRIDAESERRALEEALNARFPAATWRDSDVGQMWNFRYLYVRREIDGRSRW
jgi:hypothetical protein